MERSVGVRIEGDASGYAAAVSQADVSTRKLKEATDIADVGMKRMGVSAGQTAQAMRQLPMQVGDFFAQVSSGGSPMTAFIQQGLQVKDSFGGAGNAISAVTGLLTPAKLALGATAIAVAAVSLAAQQGAAEFAQYHRQIILTGNAAGVTAGQLDQLAQRAAAATGATQNTAAGIAAGLVGTGQVKSSALDIATRSSIQLQRSLGIEVEKTAQAFASLGRDPLQASIKLNEQWNYLTLGTYNQIKALEKHGKVAEAAKLAQEEFAKAGIARAEQMEKHLGTLEKLWRGVGDAAGTAWGFMLNIGRENTLQNQMAIQQERLNSLPLGDKARAAAQARVDTLRESIKFENQAAAERARQAQVVTDQVARDKRPINKPGAYGPIGPRTFDEMYPAADIADLLKKSPNGLPFGLGQQSSNGVQFKDVFGEAMFGAVGDLGSPGIGATARRAEIESYDEIDKAIREAEAKRLAEARKQADEWLQHRLKLEEEMLKASQPIWERTLQSWGDVNQRMKDSWDNAFVGMVERGEDAFTRFVQSGKVNVKSLVDFISAQVARAGYREFLAAGLQLFSNYRASENNPDYSNEGRNYTPQGADSTAGALGLGGDFKRTASAGGGGGSISVALYNQSGTSLQASASKRNDGTIEVFLTAMEDRMADRVANGEGSMSAALQGRYGLRPTFG